MNFFLYALIQALLHLYLSILCRLRRLDLCSSNALIKVDSLIQLKAAK